MPATKKPASKKASVTKTKTSNVSAPAPTDTSLFADSAQADAPSTTSPSGATLRIIKKGLCPSNSGKSTLTYAIACNADKEIYLQVTSNTGGGFFSQEWVAFTSIQNALATGPDINRITSFCLYSLFKGRSVNTPAFLLAVLLAENLVKPLVRCKRVHELCNPEEFLDRMTKLMTSKVNLPDESAKTKPRIPGPPRPAQIDPSFRQALLKKRQPK